MAAGLAKIALFIIPTVILSAKYTYSLSHRNQDRQNRIYRIFASVPDLKF
jgi:hypothetical protein